MTVSREDMSLGDLDRLIGTTGPQRIVFDWMLAPDYAAQRKAVEAAIDFITSQVVKYRQGYQNHSEDEITIQLVVNLRGMGFNASHDTQIGGHCDIVVEGRNEFLWLAEAKIHRSYGWLVDGTKQLLTRYSTGVPGQDSADLLIYYFGENAQKFMSKWHQRLVNEYPKATVSWCESRPNDLRSVHTHKSSGIEFFMRHKVISLMFEPEK